MKKTMLILSAVALVLILAVGGGIWFFISKLTAKEAVPEKSTVETYLNEHWSFYRLRSWDPASGALELDYPQRHTFEQMKKYGAALDFSADALAQTQHMQDIRYGLSQVCSVSPTRIVVHGVSSDGREVYTVNEAGDLKACWLSEEAHETEP